MKVFLSPSTQDHNAYAGGSNEEREMRDLTAVIAPILRAAGHEVKVGGTISAGTNVIIGNIFLGGTGYYVAVHSNAGGGHGTEVWHYPGSNAGKRMAAAIYKRLAPVSVGKPDRGIKSSRGYIELHGPRSPAVIIECEFHDNRAGATDIKAHHETYGAAIGAGILDVIGHNAAKPKPRRHVVTTTRAGFRPRPSLKAPATDVLPKGTHLLLIANWPLWAHVQYGTRDGFVWRAKLRKA